MKNSEEAIEKVLAGLRSADPPAGMERRIVEAAWKAERDAASEWPISGWGGLRAGLMASWSGAEAKRLLAFGAALVAVLVVALVMPAIDRLGRHPEQRAVRGASQSTSAADDQSRQAAAKAVEGRAQPALHAAISPPMRKKPLVQKAAVARNGSGDSARSGDSMHDGDSVAVREMRAASLPEPPMPLTEQEKLLLRVVHRSDPVELAMLNPEMEARREAEGAVEFQKFFEPPVTEGRGKDSLAKKAKDSPAKREGDER